MPRRASEVRGNQPFGRIAGRTDAGSQTLFASGPAGPSSPPNHRITTWPRRWVRPLQRTVRHRSASSGQRSQPHRTNSPLPIGNRLSHITVPIACRIRQSVCENRSSIRWSQPPATARLNQSNQTTLRRLEPLFRLRGFRTGAVQQRQRADSRSCHIEPPRNPFSPCGNVKRAMPNDFAVQWLLLRATPACSMRSIAFESLPPVELSTSSLAHLKSLEPHHPTPLL